ncbi:ATP-binding protein [Sandarakinorhabdus sp. AAP62]|uniref:hybrid sensor histidine kinase/response regulator n=1 Tax=Sandarakinorhabdus sp. AAP62 TaxID=1248916 RepID=UPI0002E09796|nr:ATP-binding protein [Sandarakinorhabdus sp. AAP62]
MNTPGPHPADSDPGARIAALEQARAVAEAANQAKTQFLMGLSHEIRTPLNAIHGYAQLLERGAAITPSEAGRIIRRSSEHLADLVEGLLDISRIESGVMKLNRETVALRALVEQVAAMFRIEAQNKGLEFVFSVAPNLPTWVLADERRLRQVLINLLSNAIKYTETGRVTLSVRYRSMVAEFEVADTGIGIAPEDAERIFQPFDRGGGRASGVAPGIGLGLALSRMLGQIMGGEITVKSEPGAGSRFLLRLLLPQPNSAPPEGQPHGLPIGYEGRRRTILAIDDDPGQLTLWQELLRPVGFNLFVAGSGGAGLSLAELGRPDLVLLDVSMPGLNGWEVARRLRERFGRDILILMVSGNTSELVGVASTGDHDGFVLKPVDQQALFAMIGSTLGLIWTYEGTVVPRTAVTTLPEAARSHLAELARLARSGHVRGLTNALAALAQAVPDALPLVTRLTMALDEFDLAAFQKLLAEQQPIDAGVGEPKP